jgi:hypothetical protein
MYLSHEVQNVVSDDGAELSYKGGMNTLFLNILTSIIPRDELFRSEALLGFTLRLITDEDRGLTPPHGCQSPISLVHLLMFQELGKA